MKYLIGLSIFILIGCSNPPIDSLEKDELFPKVQDLKKFKQTVFLPSLESAFDPNKNSIYAASLLMAWDEIKRELSPIQNLSSPVLELMNQSKTYQDVLNNEEYISSILIEDHVITAKAFFKKSLPFEYPLLYFENELKFKGISVPSFGFFGSCPFAEIVYYKNGHDFAIKLNPEDQKHEIILMKSTFKGESSLFKYSAELEKKENAFKKEKNNHPYDWKYYFNDEDEVKIPCLEFNIEHNYAEIEGSSFESSNVSFSVLEAYQRTAFILNEKGAEIESEANLAVTDAVVEDRPKPKKMIFDKDFLILLKRKDKKHPYFAMLVVTTELMKK